MSLFQSKQIDTNVKLNRLQLTRVLHVASLALLACLSAPALATDGPEIYATIRQFEAPRRSAPRPVQRIDVPVPQVFRSRELPRQALGFAPRQQNFAPLPRLYPMSEQAEFPRGVRGDTEIRRTAAPRPRGKARNVLATRSEGRGLASATNYCVRLCDGFAFPVGNPSGPYGMQEAACRSACPGAEVMLYSAPAGAKDFDSLSRGGQSYSALPNAFRYREKIDNTCRCTTPGATASASAILADFTLRRGDLVMSTSGFRHFDGGRQLPYRRNQFSDALSKLTNKHEITVVRAMEVASVRGILSSKAPEHVRNRVVQHVRSAEQDARRQMREHRPSANLGRTFQEIRAREAQGPTTLKAVARRTGIVALN
jgi:Protein of unknown function (DUF2865)